jgi:phosphocarrier protein HPr
MPRIVKEIIIKSSQGLHARPAATFVQIVSKYNATVTVQKGKERVNGSSIMGLLTLGVQQDSTILVEIEGEDADQLLNELENFLTKEHM